MKYQCPLCQQPLLLSENSKQLVCSANHQFDRAKQGYFNLLPVQRKKSKEPGDSKEMIAARETFLAGHYYQQLAERLSQTVNHLTNDGATLLDIGCGEGYYSRQIVKENSVDLYGIDISKPAVMKAARKHQQGHYSVASSEHLPLQTASVDLAFKVHAPANDAELTRVIKSKGYLISVTPAPRHLWQLREFIYDNVREHDTLYTQFEGFEKVSSEQLSYEISPDSNNRLNILQMTPFAWKANDDIKQQITDKSQLIIELDFIISTYQKIN